MLLCPSPALIISYERARLFLVCVYKCENVNQPKYNEFIINKYMPNVYNVGTQICDSKHKLTVFLWLL